MAYLLDIVGEEPFVRLRAERGADPVLELFLQRAWGAHLAAGGADQLRRKRHEVVLQIEYALAGDEVESLFLEIVRDSPDPRFAVALRGALRATGRLANLPLVQSIGAQALVTDATFEAPDAHEDDDDDLSQLGAASRRTAPEEDAIRQRFVEIVRRPLRFLTRGRVAPGEHPFELDLWPEGDDFLVHVVASPGDPVASLVVGVMVATGRVRFDLGPGYPATP